jgi:hypothetical protein
VVNGLPNGKLFFVFAAINVLNSSFGFWLPEVRISSLSSSKHLMMLIWHPLASSF